MENSNTKAPLDPWEISPEPEKQEQPKELIRPEDVHDALGEQLNPDSNSDAKMEVLPRNKEYGLKGQFYLSQTLIKQITSHTGLDKEYCPKNIFHIYIAKDVKTKRTDPMLHGSYGEALILGKGAKGDTTYELPLLPSGKKSVAQERIEIQAERFKHLASIYQINVIPDINVQVPVFKKFGNVMLRGELDIFPTSVIWNDELSLAAVDIKFTGDVHSTFTSHSWGNVDTIDWIQADFYHYLVRDFDLELNIRHGYEFNKEVGYEYLFTDFVKKVIANNDLKFIYMIFGYKKPDINSQFRIYNRSYLDKNGSTTRANELVNRVKRAIAILNMEHKRGWPTNPVAEVCKNCPLSVLNGGTCTDVFKLNNV